MRSRADGGRELRKDRLARKGQRTGCGTWISVLGGGVQEDTCKEERETKPEPRRKGEEGNKAKRSVWAGRLGTTERLVGEGGTEVMHESHPQVWDGGFLPQPAEQLLWNPLAPTVSPTTDE